MGITQDPSTPGLTSQAEASSATTITSGSFSPPAGSLVVVLYTLGFNVSTVTAPTVTVADSGSVSYAAGPAVYDTRYDYAAIFTHHYATAPGSITVTATRNGAAAFTAIYVLVLDGAAAPQFGGGTATTSVDTSSTEQLTGAITRYTPGSWVLVACTDANNYAPTAYNANTTTLATFSDIGEAQFGKLTSPSYPTGSVTLGWTVSSGNTGYAWAALEIIPSAPFYPAVQAVRARLPYRQGQAMPSAGGVYMGLAPKATSFGSGRVQWSAGAPVQNPVPPLYSVVQHASNTASFTSGATNSATVTFGQNITPGNTVVLFIGVNMGSGDISASSVTTNGSADNWQFPQYASFYANIGISGAALDFNSAGGAAAIDYSITQSVAATTSETTSVLLDAFEVAGLGPNPGVDAFTSGDAGGASTTAWTSGSFPGDPAGANNGIFLGSVCLYVNASNTTSTVTGPGGWTNEPTLSGSIQQGGTGTGNKFFVYQLSGYEGPFSSSPPVLVYSGTNSAAADAYGTWGISLYNGITQDWWDGPVQALLPHPPAGPGSIRGRVRSNQGAPVSNPAMPSTGPVFYPARQAIRAKLPQPPLGAGAFRGRTNSSPGAPVRNPAPGPVFRQKPSPVRFIIPPWQPRAGRIGSSFGAVVQNPSHGPPVYPPHGPVRPRIPRPFAGSIAAFGQASGAVSAAINGSGFGNGTGSSGAPIRNPSRGPVFYPAVHPVRAVVPQVFSKGRVTSGHGAPVRNPSAGPALYPAQGPVRGRVPQLQPRAGRVASNPGAPVNNPAPPPATGPVFRPAVQAIRAKPPLRQFPAGLTYASTASPALNDTYAASYTANYGVVYGFSLAFSTGRVSFSYGVPPQNPAAGPAFRPAVSAIRARIPRNAPRGRIASSKGAPVQNPAPTNVGPPFFPHQPIRARLPQQPLLRGRVNSHAGAPVRNPGAGPIFRQAPAPSRIRPSLPQRGRNGSNPGGPVVNPVIGQGPAFFPLRFPARARIPQNAPRGRAYSNIGAPVRNPAPGPVFRQAVKPARTVIPQNAPRGRVYSNPGGPVSNPPPPIPGPPFRPSGAVRARYLNQVYVLGNPGLIYVNSRDGTP